MLDKSQDEEEIEVSETNLQCTLKENMSTFKEANLYFCLRIPL